jgi:hypothetical protein
MSHRVTLGDAQYAASMYASMRVRVCMRMQTIARHDEQHEPRKSPFPSTEAEETRLARPLRMT